MVFSFFPKIISVLDIYIWLSLKFPAPFAEKAKASERKRIIGRILNEILSKSFEKEDYGNLEEEENLENYGENEEEDSERVNYEIE